MTRLGRKGLLSSASDIEKTIIEWVNLNGGSARKIHVFPSVHGDGVRGKNPAMRGMSDLLICWHGLYIACEVKTKGDRQRQDQKNFQFEVERANGIYMIVSSFNDFQSKLEKTIDG